MQTARKAGVKLRAEFVPTDRNRAMDITYRLSGFTEVAQIDGAIIFEHDLKTIHPFPAYITVAV